MSGRGRRARRSTTRPPPSRRRCGSAACCADCGSPTPRRRGRRDGQAAAASVTAVRRGGRRPRLDQLCHAPPAQPQVAAALLRVLRVLIAHVEATGRAEHLLALRYRFDLLLDALRPTRAWGARRAGRYGGRPLDRHRPAVGMPGAGVRWVSASGARQRGSHACGGSRVFQGVHRPVRTPAADRAGWRRGRGAPRTGRVATGGRGPVPRGRPPGAAGSRRPRGVGSRRRAAARRSATRRCPGRRSGDGGSSRRLPSARRIPPPRLQRPPVAPFPGRAGTSALAASRTG